MSTLQQTARARRLAALQILRGATAENFFRDAPRRSARPAPCRF